MMDTRWDKGLPRLSYGKLPSMANILLGSTSGETRHVGDKNFASPRHVAAENCMRKRGPMGIFGFKN